MSSLTVANSPAEATLRRDLLITSFVAITFSVLHHIDHVIRGNHIGWPLTPDINAFTFSLLIYPLALSDVFLLLRGHLAAGYALFIAIGGFILVSVIHISPWAIEPLHEVYHPHEPNNFGAVLAVFILISLIISLLVLIGLAIRARLVAGRW